MRELNMIDFTSTPKAVNGLFGVPKDGTEIRLIIDATPANRFFIPCPPLTLPDPGVLARLSVASGDELWMAKTDLESFYHQLVLPRWLQSYFALPGFKAEELLVNTLASSVLHSLDGPEPSPAELAAAVPTLPSAARRRM